MGHNDAVRVYTKMSVALRNVVWKNRADCTMSDTCNKWFCLFKAECNNEMQWAAEWDKKIDEQNTWWRGDRWPEKMSAMATSVDLRSSLRPRSGSFHSVTLRDDCEMTLPHSHITNTCHLSLDFFSGGRSFMCNQTSEQHAEIPRKGRLWRWISKMTTCLLLFFLKKPTQCIVHLKQ